MSQPIQRSPHPLPDEDRDRVERIALLVERARCARGGTAPHFLAHLRLETRQGPRDLLVASGGSSLVVGDDLWVAHWQTPAVAEILFGCRVDDECELDLAGRSLAGTLREASLLRFAANQLVEVADRVARRVRVAVGSWARLAPLEGLAPRSEADRARAAAEVQLDAAQRRAVELPAGRALLVLGEAGCGKTTVALHRLATLRRQAGAGFRAAVVVPVDGLRRLVEQLLRELGVRDAAVWLYDRWAGAQARRAFPELPKRESADATAAVARLKRHPALRPLLLERARTAPSRDEDAPAASEPRGLATREDLHELFGDLAIMRRIAEVDPAVNEAMVQELFEHTRVQFNPRAEEEYAHVDADRLATLDGEAIDAGTPTEDAGTIDVEDFAVLFELDRVRAKHQGVEPSSPTRYDCLVLDEAQEYASLELSLLGRSLAPGGTLIVAGDAEQQLDPTGGFAGWSRTLDDLHVADWETVTLEASYRSPLAVAQLARAFVGRTAPAPRRARSAEHAHLGGEDGAVRCPGALRFARFDDELHCIVWLVNGLRALREQDPDATVAVLCRTPERARRLVRLVRYGLHARLALDGEFVFLPGITVTCAEEVKGLEFDFVIVPDAGASEYPDSTHARRALYVATTRAIHQLVLATVGPWSPLVSAVLPPASSPSWISDPGEGRWDGWGAQREE